MGFLDKVTKAVSETVDRGKKEVDQFMRIQKVKGDIGREEEAVRAAGARAQQVKQEIGDAVIARLKAGTLVDAELQALAARVTAIDKEIEAHQGVIAEKRVEIARIEAETAAPPPGSGLPAEAVPKAGAPVAAAPPPVPAAPPAVPAVPAAAVPPPLPVPVAPASVPAIPTVAGAPTAPAVTTACPQCGASLKASSAFCTECGAKLS